MAVGKVQVGDVLELKRRKVAVELDTTYREIGLRSFGRGVFHKDEITGLDLGSKKVFEIHPNDLLVSNVFAWEGAVAVAGQNEEGFIGSHRFMTWVPKTKSVHVPYIAAYLTSEVGIKKLGSASPGSAGRNRTLGIGAFQNIEIPLPRFDEQRRIVRRLVSVEEAVKQSAIKDQRAVLVIDSLENDVITGVLRGGVALGQLVEINPTPRRVQADSHVAFAPMASLNVASGTFDTTEMRTRVDIGSGYKQFVRGDIVFARITPSMQNGKSAIFDDPKLEVGYGTTEFHVLRPRSTELTQAVHALVRSTWFKTLAMKSFTGTAGQQRVPAAFLEQVNVPDLRLPATRAAIERLKQLEDERWHFKHLVKRRRELAEALPKSVRNEIFSQLV